MVGMTHMRWTLDRVVGRATIGGRWGHQPKGISVGDYGHVTAWSGIRSGRERQALELWGDALDFYEKSVANGLIEEYDTQLFQPTGSALPLGITTLWGSQDQMDAIERNPDRMALQMRAGLLLEGGNALLEGIGTFQTALTTL